ncbi:hypothetical protein DL96DRAFT_1825361 [Flagelloscypha sp. PMI_526]|nr:hypothetical protein DL96DRAFT_1825361 [Flagelloscypha sp. PMI_526]
MGPPSQGIRVISFDGASLDATGLSELLILEDIAGKWAWDRDDDDREGGDVRVSEICDIVGGTGIGGFYAILFSLNLTVGQVIASHRILQDVVFSSDVWERKDSTGCVAVLKAALAMITEEVGLDVDFDSPFISKNSLKCFICVLNDLNPGCARALRNYSVRSSKSPRCSIREAIHATLADGIHLPPARTQDEQFICGSSNVANPSYELMKELPAIFSKGSDLACFINLGAGSSGFLRMILGEPCEEQARPVRDAEAIGQNLFALYGGLGPCYFRFSVMTAVESSMADLSDDVFRIVKSFTVGYLEKADIRVHLDAAVDLLTKRHKVVSLQRLGSLAAEDGKAKLNAQVEALHDHVVHMKKTMDDELYCKIKDWLTPIDQTAKLDSCIRTRSSSTCGWLWDSPRVVRWQKMGGIFWCHAGMGAGKTIIMSHAVETLKKVPDQSFVAYYYFEFTNPSTLSEEALFRSLVSQLSHANYAASQHLYEQHRNGSLQPQLSTLYESLRDLSTGTPLPVYIIIDALDELPLPRRKYLIKSLLGLSPPEADGIHIMVTSRDELDIHQGFSGKVSLDFAIEKEMVYHDIMVFVDQQLSVEKWKSWPKHDVLNMRNILIEKADGMFRMVACQIEVLKETQSTEDMRRALSSLPATLGDTYLYILNAIPSHLRSRAHTILCILCAALEPVSIAELSALAAVELGDPTDPITLPAYRKSLRYHEPQNIIGLGTALVRRTTTHVQAIWDEEEEALQFSHASVKEYLLQGACSWCGLNDRLANETTARACLALLTYNEDPRHTFGVVNINYARDNWWRHIHPNHGVQLLSQQKKLFKTFPWPHSSPRRGLSYRVSASKEISFLKSALIFAAGTSLEQLIFTMLESPFQWKFDDLNDALQAAAQMGSSTALFTALIEKGGDVNSVTIDGTPILHNGADSNQLHVVRVLVESGADVNAVGGRHGSALQAAARSRGRDVIKFLVESGADVNIKGGKYGSALQAAAYRSQIDIVKFLVQSGADVNIVGGWYGFALQAAAIWGTLDLVKFLVESGADVNMAGGEFGSALQAAASTGALDVVKFLVDSGADANIGGGKCGSALQEAANRGALDIVKVLVESGASVNMEGGQFGTALQAAAIWGAVDLVEFLVENGADVNIAGGEFGSALQAAAGRGALEVVKFLVESGADVNAVGGRHKSALEAAESRTWLYWPLQKRQETIAFLIAAGAVRTRSTHLLDDELKGEDSSTEYNSDSS